MPNLNNLNNQFWGISGASGGSGGNLEHLYRAQEQSNRDYQRMVDQYQRYNDMTFNPGIGQYGGYTTTWATSGGDNSSASEAKKNAVGVKVLNKIKAAAKPFTVDEAHAENAISKADEYKALGLELLAHRVEHKTNKILREMAISVAGYKRINRGELDKFCEELAAVSDISSKRKLLETPLKYYVGAGITEGDAVAEKDLAVPPADVLEKLKIARDAKLFDDYAVLHIKYVPDPILCGTIKESNDLYFIAEWGDDVKLSDIVKE